MDAFIAPCPAVKALLREETSASFDSRKRLPTENTRGPPGFIRVWFQSQTERERDVAFHLQTQHSLYQKNLGKNAVLAS